MIVVNIKPQPFDEALQDRILDAICGLVSSLSRVNKTLSYRDPRIAEVISSAAQCRARRCEESPTDILHRRVCLALEGQHEGVVVIVRFVG